jgi:hypothetical protein
MIHHCRFAVFYSDASSHEREERRVDIVVWKSHYNVDDILPDLSPVLVGAIFDLRHAAFL